MLVHSSWDSEAGIQVVTVSGVLREAAAAGLSLAIQLLFRCLLLPPCFWPSVITPELMFSWVAVRCFLPLPQLCYSTHLNGHHHLNCVVFG